MKLNKEKAPVNSTSLPLVQCLGASPVAVTGLHISQGSVMVQKWVCGNSGAADKTTTRKSQGPRMGVSNPAQEPAGMSEQPEKNESEVCFPSPMVGGGRSRRASYTGYIPEVWKKGK